MNICCFKTIAIDTPGRNLSLVKNIKAQTTALNRAITYSTETNFKKYLIELTFRCYTCNIFRAIKVLQYVEKLYIKRNILRLQKMVKDLN